MTNQEIFDFMLTNKINLLFKNIENRKAFLYFISIEHPDRLIVSYDKYIETRHITFFDKDGCATRSNRLMQGDSPSWKEDFYYEDLFNEMTVELI